MENEAALSAIAEALSHAGEDQQMMERLAHLDVRRITPDTALPQIEFLFTLFGKPCFPRGELVALTGKPKSGKTFVSSILMALCFREEVLSMKRRVSDEGVEEPVPELLRVLWYDTEQSDESTQDILKNRIMQMIGDEDIVNDHDLFESGLFQVFNVRQDTWTERLPLLEAAITRYKPDLVIVDGIRDLINDINDGVLAQDTVERLMHLASDNRCCITCILHQNKAAEDKNLRGWIGTELTHKAFEVYECEKGEDRVFSLTQKMTRKYDIIQSLNYVVDDQGIPQLAEYGQGGNGKSNGFNRDYISDWDEKNKPILNIPLIFHDAMPDEKELHRAKELEATVMKMVNIGSYQYYNKLKDKAIEDGVIFRVYNKEGYVCYTRCPANDQELLFADQSHGEAPY